MEEDIPQIESNRSEEENGFAVMLMYSVKRIWNGF
jgi:hypothetical protein